MRNGQSNQRENAAIPSDFLPYLEKIAEGVHNCWAECRLREGWRYGEKYDQSQKLHPCLIPYGQLPESEKEYDRRTSQYTMGICRKSRFPG